MHMKETPHEGVERAGICRMTTRPDHARVAVQATSGQGLVYVNERRCVFLDGELRRKEIEYQEVSA